MSPKARPPAASAGDEAAQAAQAAQAARGTPVLPGEFDWDLVRSFLAVVDAGSLSAAARALSSTQPTLGRRIEALEAQLGATLFERTGRGLAPTPEALRIAGHARRMRDGADGLARAATGSTPDARAFVRVAAARQIAIHVLPELVAGLPDGVPEIDVGIVASDDVSNLLRREADVAIRHVRPEQTSLVARKVGEMRVRAFASAEYLERRGTPRSAAELLRRPLVGGDRDREFAVGIERAATALGVDPADVRVAVRSDDRPVQLAAVAAGLGIGFALEPVIERHPGLVALDVATGLPTLPVWLAVHREIRTVPAIRRVYDVLGAALESMLR